jgi:hypothetical protein
VPRARILSVRELSLAYLERQFLLRRMPIGPVQALRRLVAIQAQYSPSPYLALAARLEPFRITDLEDCLRAGQIVKATLMRGTLHLATASEFPVIAAVVRDSIVGQWQRNWGHPDVDTGALAAGLAEFLAVPRAAAEIREHAAALTRGALPPRALLQSAKLLVPTIHVPPSGFWRSHGAPGLVLWKTPLPPLPSASSRLARVDSALATLAPLSHMFDEQGRELVDLPRAQRPRDEGSPVAPRFLPKWDSALLSHADRSRILPEDMRARVINPANGDVLSTYLLDGVVAGSWTVHREHRLAVVRLRPLRLGRDHGASAVEEEARRIARIIEPDATKIDVELTCDDREMLGIPPIGQSVGPHEAYDTCTSDSRANIELRATIWAFTAVSAKICF